MRDDDPHCRGLIDDDDRKIPETNAPPAPKRIAPAITTRAPFIRMRCVARNPALHVPALAGAAANCPGRFLFGLAQVHAIKDLFTISRTIRTVARRAMAKR